MNTRKFTAKKAIRSVPILLRAVRRGQRIEIIDRGLTIAIMEPAEPREPTWWERQRAVEALKKRWATQPHVTVGRENVTNGMKAWTADSYCFHISE